MGFSLECPDIGTQMMLLGYQIGFHNSKHPEDKTRLTISHICRDRIAVARNKAVQDATDRQATHLLMIDPDISIDHYVVAGESWARQWWPTVLSFVSEHPGAVVAAPYTGQGYPPPVHVFDWNSEDKPRRISWEEAAIREGWQQVAAVGTGLMLIDMAVFDRMEVPYFDDVCSDARKVKVEITPDVYFSLKCRDAGVPIYVNWDCWCGHWQNQVVESPRVGGRCRVAVSNRIRPEAAHGPGCVRENAGEVVEETVCGPDADAVLGEAIASSCGSDHPILVGPGL